MSFFSYPSYYYPSLPPSEYPHDQNPYNPGSHYLPPSNYYHYLNYPNSYPYYGPYSEKMTQQRKPEMYNVQEIKAEQSQKQEKDIQQPQEKNKILCCQKRMPQPKKKKINRKCINKEKKIIRDQQYILFEQKPQQKKIQKQGRNNNSNIYRTFVKLIKSETFEQNVKFMFNKIRTKFQLTLEYNQFYSALKEQLPNFTNYINNKEFKRLYKGQKQFNKCFRILFHCFRRSFAINHILTIAYRDRIKKQNLDQFIKTLHFIQNTINEKK